MYYYGYPQPHHVSPHFVLVRSYSGVESWELFDLRKDPGEKGKVAKELIVENNGKKAFELFNQKI
ncbi:sulfatase/phosphatase domain-containing protein [Chitinophaga sancti]|uniref:DUF4976 domain-containing protein n=1 Tax=Chitinophaga sancti TaxID=1004 RepID=A0ABZ0XR09_9BACT|nr:sulfatase/phosphatase domain-containing protein [Chitinophaga sancti]WQG93124.1 DUF4976 domain-containing protein [Chitinophaga sancti]